MHLLPKATRANHKILSKAHRHLTIRVCPFAIFEQCWLSFVITVPQINARRITRFAKKLYEEDVEMDPQFTRPPRKDLNYSMRLLLRSVWPSVKAAIVCSMQDDAPKPACEAHETRE